MHTTKNESKQNHFIFLKQSGERKILKNDEKEILFRFHPYLKAIFLNGICHDINNPNLKKIKIDRRDWNDRVWEAIESLANTGRFDQLKQTRSEILNAKRLPVEIEAEIDRLHYIKLLSVQVIII